ncbi:DNA topoisomerase III [Marinibactrum halimedae]|uniref:DNA topoisomerase n=1 Tax=Marinibactrum halimedae TaxID=1444977 RepID=A0AA37T663_9GAMM|nr:DNA topoisomerase III [Marinibactrum halimedae]MCD9458019.1 DNA topoisomerase III [Marinibactrum halimedae]GLS27645.1 DNA topoisomerase 3 [Marinibactrum halimedae]
MIVYIAEKPSLGRAIAEVLPKPLVKSEGFVTAADGTVVTWCIGHLLEQAEPEVYNSEFKKWSHTHLPIIPHPWKLTTKASTAKQLGVVRKLIKKSTGIIHAGDPDREGQLLVDEVIDYVGVSAEKKRKIKRCLIADLNASAVRRSIANLRDNSEFIALSVSALARARADWLFGINLTRAYTLQGQKGGYKGVLSVGRVQTPVLGLVVRRDEEIAQFQSKPFYEVWANLFTENQERFRAKWVPSEHCLPYLDESGRNLSRALAENVVSRISHKPASVVKVEAQPKRIPPPLPHNLSALQIDANKRFGLSAQNVLDAAQSLYEKHKLITYPRSDCRYLPLEHFNDASMVAGVVQGNAKQLGLSALVEVSLSFAQKSRAWNDKKVGAHHAIIPTKKSLSNTQSLTLAERQVYELISRQYLIQFLPDHRFEKTTVTITIEGGKFIATSKQVQVPGWKVLFKAEENEVKGGKDKTLKERENFQWNSDASGSDPFEVNNSQLPALVPGQRLHSEAAEVVEKQTSPPKPYTDATLLGAMTGIAKYVKDPALKKVLRETDGLGTEATRAGIIELLFRRGFLERQGKAVRATDSGQAFIRALPERITLPDMTAQWEFQLSAISEQRSTYDSMITPLIEQVGTLVLESQTVIPEGLRGLGDQKATYSKRTTYKRKKANTATGQRKPRKKRKKSY